MGTRLAEESQQLDQVRLVGVWDHDPPAAEHLASRLSSNAFPDVRSLIHNAAIQAVIVATPPRFHHRYACAAARAGKHVFCEKPMATTLSDCDDIIQTCELNGVRLMVGHLTRFHPLLCYVRQAIQKGGLGEPVCISLRRLGGPWSEGDWFRPWRLKRNESGGALLEINCHELDFLRLIGGDVDSVYAVGGRFRQLEADYPDQMLLSLRFSSGAIGHLHSSQASAIGAYGGRVDCTNGSVVFPAIFGSSPVIHLCRFGEEPRVIGPEEFAEVSPVAEEMKAFLASIRGQTPPPVTGQDGRSVVEIALAAYESLDTSRPASLPLR